MYITYIIKLSLGLYITGTVVGEYKNIIELLFNNIKFNLGRE